MQTFLCPDKHYVPSTYGEISRDGSGERGRDGKTNEEREAERQTLLESNGQPPRSQSLTCALMEWSFDMLTGRRCWYCGVRNLSQHGISTQTT